MSTKRVDDTERSSRRPGKNSALEWRHYETPWGEGLVAVDEQGLRFVDLPRGNVDLAAPSINKPVAGESRAGAAVSAGTEHQCLPLDHWVAALEEYFRGDRLAWSSQEIPWDVLSVSAFEREVYEALLTVSPGETVSYGRLAEMAGHPRAARAVGSAMAANPVPVVIPCHRVIRSDGSLGNYGDDPEWKLRLLRHERSVVEAKRSH